MILGIRDWGLGDWVGGGDLMRWRELGGEQGRELDYKIGEAFGGGRRPALAFSGGKSGW
jgi:hypothetical protein